MIDPALRVAFDGLPSYSVVQGEDRHVVLSLTDAHTGLPVDLTNAVGLAWQMPALGGAVLKRGSIPVPVTAGQVTGPPPVFSVPDHGLAMGDLMTVVKPGLAAPPVVAVTVLDAADFALSDLSGNPLTPGVGALPLAPFSLVDAADTAIAVPTSGTAVLRLSALATAQLNPGYGQATEVKIQYSDGSLRIAVLFNSLDVYLQTAP